MAAPTQTPRPPAWPLSWMGSWHRAFVFQRRTRVLAEMLAAQIPPSASVLDIGCGDGTIGSLIAQLRPDISIQGVEFMVRPGCKIGCRAFDGNSPPFHTGILRVGEHVHQEAHVEGTILKRQRGPVERTASDFGSGPYTE